MVRRLDITVTYADLLRMPSTTVQVWDSFTQGEQEMHDAEARIKASQAVTAKK